MIHGPPSIGRTFPIERASGRKRAAGGNSYFNFVFVNLHSAAAHAGTER